MKKITIFNLLASIILFSTGSITGMEVGQPEKKLGELPSKQITLTINNLTNNQFLMSPGTQLKPEGSISQNIYLAQKIKNTWKPSLININDETNKLPYELKISYTYQKKGTAWEMAFDPAEGKEKNIFIPAYYEHILQVIIIYKDVEQDEWVMSKGQTIKLQTQSTDIDQFTLTINLKGDNLRQSEIRAAAQE